MTQPDADAGFDLFADPNSGDNQQPIQQPVAEVPGTQVPTNAPPAQGGTETPDAGTEGQPLEPKNDSKRFEYWQSQAAKLHKQNTELGQWAPVIRYIQENPKFLDTIESDIRSKGSSGNALGEAPKPPERPKKPGDYKLDDVQTPGSPSWQYHQDLLEYNANVADYQVARDSFVEKRQQLESQKQAAQQQQYQQYRELAETVQMQHGMTPEEAEDFLGYYTNPKYKLHQLVQLYRMNKHQQRAAALPPVPPTSPFGPPPAATASAASSRLPQVPVDETQRLNEDFLAEYRRMRGVPPTKR
jgi:hypothetical protein